MRLFYMPKFKMLLEKTEKVTHFDFLIPLESSQSCGAKGDKDRPDQDRQPAGRGRLTCS